MLGLLGSLMFAYVRLERGRTEGSPVSLWFVDKTFRIYLGWVGLATILNISIWLDSLGWTGAPLAAPMWGVIMLGVACSLYLYLGFTYRDVAVLGVLAWASLGIGIKNQAEEMIWIASLVVCVVSIAAGIRIVFLTRSQGRATREA